MHEGKLYFIAESLNNFFTLSEKICFVWNFETFHEQINRLNVWSRLQ